MVPRSHEMLADLFKKSEQVAPGCLSILKSTEQFSSHKLKITDGFHLDFIYRWA